MLTIVITCFLIGVRRTADLEGSLTPRLFRGTAADAPTVSSLLPLVLVQPLRQGELEEGCGVFISHPSNSTRPSFQWVRPSSPTSRVPSGKWDESQMRYSSRSFWASVLGEKPPRFSMKAMPAVLYIKKYPRAV